MGKTSALTNFLFLIAPAVLGLLLWISFAFVAGIGPLASLVLAVLFSMGGFVLLTVAKLPLFRAGRWFSFGPEGLGERGRTMYFSGWILIALSALLCFGLLFLRD